MVLAIYGAGGLGKELADLAIINNDNKWEKIVFVDDTEGISSTINEIEVISYEEFKKQYPIEKVRFLIAQGEPQYRELLYNKIINDDYRLEILVDKSARVSKSVHLGEGTIICENVCIHANTNIGINCLIQPMSVIGHDTCIGNHVVLSAFCAPGGKCRFEDKAYAGMNVTILQELTIGHDAIIGMGSVVYRNVDSNTTVLGNPARITKGNDNRRVYN